MGEGTTRRTDQERPLPEDEALFEFAPEESTPAPKSGGPLSEPPASAPRARWKILVVDDDEDMLLLTQFTLKDFEWDGHGARLLFARSGAEALATLKEHPDVALILLDVIMETDDAGLRFADVVRTELGNAKVRIVLRTGQAGLFDELDVMRRYDVNGYLPKHELSRTRLVSEVIAALRDHDLLERVESLKEKLLASSRRAALGDLAAGVVHDLNNPLTIAILHQQRALQMLGAEGRPPDEAQARRSLLKVGEACQRIQRLGAHLLSFARSRKEEPEIIPVRVLVECALQFCERKILSSGVTVDLTSLPADLRLRTRHHEVERVIVNVVNNACDAMVESPTRVLSIAWGTNEDSAHLSIRDMGSGIPEEVVPSIFESFFSTKTPDLGTGLGLSVSRGIMRDNGGDLVLHETRPGIGSEFRLIFSSETLNVST